MDIEFYYIYLLELIQLLHKLIKYSLCIHVINIYYEKNIISSHTLQ
jgi:hypothetical protein